MRCYLIINLKKMKNIYLNMQEKIEKSIMEKIYTIPVNETFEEQDELLELTVGEDGVGLRLDAYLAAAGEMTRSAAAKPAFTSPGLTGTE